MFGYVGLLGLVLLLSSEGSGRRDKRKRPRRSLPGEEKQSWNWKAWVLLAVFAIPVFVFGAFVLIEAGPILGVMFLIIVPFVVYDVLKGPPGRPQSGRVSGDGVSRDVGGV